VNTLQQGFAPVVYDDFIEKALKEIEGLLQGSYQLSQRAIGLLLLQEDEEIHELIKKREPDNYRRVKILVKETKEKFNQPISYIIAMKKQETAKELLNHAVSKMAVSGWTLSELISRITVHPLTGIPILLLVLYFGLYKFVGIFGGGTVVDFLEGTVFVSYINPWVNRLVEASIPWPVVQDLLAHDYGIITLGVRYAVALVLPIVATFLFFFPLLKTAGTCRGWPC
jgi:ferrous iron transport protein B